MRYFSLLILIILVVPFVASGETVLREGSAISVDTNEKVDGDYYVSVGLFGNTTMSGKVMGDMYALGGSVTVNGEVAEDLSILGGVSQIHASVTDDVRIVAGEVVVAEHVGGDLFVLAGNLKILSSAKVDGNVYFFGGDGLIEGEVVGSVHGTNNNLRIDGPVGDDIDVKTYHQLTLGSKASVVGDVKYTSDNDVQRATDATVEGELMRSTIPVVSGQDNARSALIPVLVTLFATLTLYLLFGRKIVTLINESADKYAINSLVGLGVIVLAPFVSLMMMVTILGFLVGILAAALTAILLVAGYALSGIVCGAYLAKLMKKEFHVSLPWIVLGTLALQIAMLVPIIGPVVVLLVYTFTVGMLSTGLYKRMH